MTEISDLASQISCGGLPTALSQEGAVDGVPTGKTLTRQQLDHAKSAFALFKDLVDKEKVHPKDKKGGEKPEPEKILHHLVITGGLGFLDLDHVDSTENHVLKCCKHALEPPEATMEPPDGTICVLLDSSGGSLDSAFRTVLFLRHFAKHIRVYVPRRAKSAATLIAVGADAVCMSRYAELGPLDTQIKDPRNPTRTISTLDCYQSVDYVQKFSLKTLPSVLWVLLRETESRIPLADLVEVATNFSRKEIAPILKQVNVLDFGGWGRTLKIGETYASELQRRRADPRSTKKIAEMSHKLVYEYTHHPYVIDIHEANDVGFEVAAMPREQYDAALAVVEALEGSRFVGCEQEMEDHLHTFPNEAWTPGGTSLPSKGSDIALAHLGADGFFPPGQTDSIYPGQA